MIWPGGSEIVSPDPHSPANIFWLQGDVGIAQETKLVGLHLAYITCFWIRGGTGSSTLFFQNIHLLFSEERI